MIERRQYTDWLQKYRENGLIKVISGVRRSGKSVLFELYQEKLKADGIGEEQIIHLNFEDLRHYKLRNFLELNKHVLNRTRKKQRYYIFLDEIQNVYRFEETVNSLNLQENLDIYITGSNSYYMSSELATVLSGRYVELKIFPLSYKEYQSQYTYASQEALYQNYCRSAFPYLADKPNDETQAEYLQSTYNAIVLKDIVSRYKITQRDVLERILRFMMNGIGSEISINKIKNTLQSSGIPMANKTIEKFIDALESALILYHAPRYDIKGRDLLQRFGKYYAVDLGFRNLMLPDAPGDDGHILENVIYLELKRRYRFVYVGRSGDFEVDFVALDDERNPAYFQVALQTLGEEILERELRSLRLINDSHPKYLLTLDTAGKRTANFGGIHKMNAIDWLMDG